MKLITEYDKDARLILCVFARKHEKQNRQLRRVLFYQYVLSGMFLYVQKEMPQ
jgi:hypothetical protein